MSPVYLKMLSLLLFTLIVSLHVEPSFEASVAEDLTELGTEAPEKSAIKEEEEEAPKASKNGLTNNLLKAFKSMSDDHDEKFRKLQEALRAHKKQQAEDKAASDAKIGKQEEINAKQDKVVKAETNVESKEIGELKKAVVAQKKRHEALKSTLNKKIQEHKSKSKEQNKILNETIDAKTDEIGKIKKDVAALKKKHSGIAKAWTKTLDAAKSVQKLVV